ncbi:MAG TPA: hypothetical protein VGD91_07160, partial [Trebonia sp.]
MDDESQPDDIVELGRQRSRLPDWPRLPDWRPSRGAAAFAVAALAVGLAAGYAAGNRHDLPRPEKTASPAPASASVSAPAAKFPFTDSSAVSQDTPACSTQTGHELQLGVQLTNQSSAPIVLQTARSVVPAGGLKQVTWQWAPCGALPGDAGQADEILAPDASIWLTATFAVQVRCPVASPVQFTVGFVTQGRSATVTLPGFPDLGQVAYSGCPAVIPLGGTTRLSASLTGHP